MISIRSLCDDGIEGDLAFPIVMDMDGDGVEIATVEASTAMFDFNGDGFRSLSAWATGETGCSVRSRLRRTDHGSIRDRLRGLQGGRGERSEGLAAFDTNGDGFLDAADDQWSQFGVWIDHNQDGVSDEGEFQGMESLNIRRVSLTSDNQQQQLSDGSTILGTTTFELETGESLAAADAALFYTRAGYRVADDGYAEVRTDANGMFGVAEDDIARSVDLGDANLYGFIAGNGTDHITAGSAEGALIAGGGGDDVLTGSAGDDWIAGGAGADNINAGDGNDVVFFDAADAAAQLIHAGGGTDFAWLKVISAFKSISGPRVSKR